MGGHISVDYCQVETCLAISQKTNTSVCSTTVIEHWHLHVSFSVVARFIPPVAIDTNDIYFSPLFKYNIWSSETAVSVITQMFSHLWLFLKTILFGTPLVMSLLVFTPCKVLRILPSARKWFYSISWQSHNHGFINSPKHPETGTSETVYLRNHNSHVFDLKKKEDKGTINNSTEEKRNLIPVISLVRHPYTAKGHSQP